MRTELGANSLKSALTLDPYHTLHPALPTLHPDVNNVYYVSHKSYFQLSNCIKAIKLVKTINTDCNLRVLT